MVRLATFGLVNPGPSATQRQDAQFEAAIRTVLRGNHKVGVLGKGGVGKTSVAASVGSIFAELRKQDRVVAIDADTAFGRLSSRIDPQTSGSFWELTADQNLQSFSDVIARVGRNPAGLHVLGGEPATGPRRVLDPAIYREAALRLDPPFRDLGDRLRFDDGRTGHSRSPARPGRADRGVLAMGGRGLSCRQDHGVAVGSAA